MGNKIEQRCIIMGSAPINDNSVFLEFDIKSSYVICADGGLDNAVKYGIRPDLIIGDFDSLRSALPDHVETIRLKVEKDDTDMLAAVKEGMKRGFTDFVLLGSLGGKRFDHSYANLCTLHYIVSKGCRAVAADEHMKIFFLSGGKLILSELKGSCISVFPFGTASCIVSYIGLKYPLTEATLYADNPLGVSNEIVEDRAEITVKSGNAVVMLLNQ